MARLPAGPALDVREVQPRWYAHDWNRAGVYRLAAGILGALPRRARLYLAAALSRALPFPTERAKVSANLARVVPGASAAQRDALATDLFRHFAMCFADLISTNRSEPHLDRLLACVAGRSNLDAAMDEGRGVILLTAHLGNWELAGRLLALRVARPTHVLVAAEADPGVGRFLRAGPAPVRFVTRSEPTTGVTLLTALRRNEIVAMQGDRALGTRGDVAVDFFGAPAPFPLGPFVLARAAASPLVPAFCVLGGDRRYTITVGEPIRVEPDAERAALVRWVCALEEMVRRHPEQWFNFYDVWSTAPAH